MKVKLIFNDWVVENIKTYYLKKGTPKPEDFNGPDFDDVMGVSYDAQFYTVNLEDGTVYRYPIEHISRVKEY